MCNFFSCIILKDGRVFRNEEIDFQSDNHETIRNAHPRLLCNSGDSSEWVRIEIKPPNQNIMEKNLKKWEYRFDSNYTPSWYERNVQHYKDLCLAELGRIMIPYWDKMKTLDLRTALESGDKQSVKFFFNMFVAMFEDELYDKFRDELWEEAHDEGYDDGHEDGIDEGVQKVLDGSYDLDLDELDELINIYRDEIAEKIEEIIRANL